MLRELGPRAGLRYAASRFDPRRFIGADGRFDWAAAGAWIKRQL